MAYGFIRSTDTWGANSIPWQAMANAGLTPLFASNDPNLDTAMQNARQQGQKAGVWIPAGGEGDPRQYAAKVKGLYDKYGGAVVPNIEFTGKGNQGSAGWQWSEDMMSELERLGIPPEFAVTMLGNQTDFNYGAYAKRGAKLLPESFGANTGKDFYDPDVMRAVLRQQGVADDQIDVLLAPSQARGGRGGSVFTIDDLTPEQLASLTPQQQRQLQSRDAGTESTGGVPPEPDLGRVRDKDNPEAVRYSTMRLAQLRRMGYDPADYGITGDPTSVWRQMSAIMGANQAAKQGKTYETPEGTNEQVAAAIRQLATGEKKPFIPRGGKGDGYRQVKAKPGKGDGYRQVSNKPPAAARGRSASAPKHSRRAEDWVQLNEVRRKSARPLPKRPRPSIGRGRGAKVA